MIDLNKYKYEIALNSFQKFSDKKLRILLKIFKNEENIFKASSEELIKASVSENTAYAFSVFKKDFNFEKIINQLIKEDIGIITLEDDNYPALLKEIYDPPHLLYYKGKIEQDNNINIAVVGSRKYSHYGEQAVEKIVGDLARNNITIVSGLALGIDALAHRATINNNGRTIAVLGTGIDAKSIYPKMNKFLSDQIIESGGLILSEFPIETPPEKYNFPKRNRIISGLCLGTLLIEAAEKSGTLITARTALEQNREVFAIPGSIFSQTSKGTNQFIKEGAKIVTSADEIIETFDIEKIESQIKTKQQIQTTIEEEMILKLLNHEPTHIDEITHDSKLPAPQVSSTLIIMEMKGLIKNIGGMEYIIINF
ncbi:DNA-processing protein DprA [Candidatus Parcubacteria bacterium]|nr:DNA-processing protein DprA [Candidatus Parcubacteria bacterium]